MPDPDAATTAAADALRENRRQSIWLPQEPGWATRIAGIAVAAARPVIAAEAAAAQHDESRAIYEEEMRRDLPACPHCGCRTSSEADVRDCGCDSGCNDGEWAPGVNVLVAEAAADERQRIVRRLRIMAENFADDKNAYAVLRRAADVLEGDDDDR